MHPLTLLCDGLPLTGCIVKFNDDRLGLDGLRSFFAVQHKLLACRNILRVGDHRALVDPRVVASFTCHILDVTIALTSLV